jgi:hypothetical protein
MQWDRSNRSIAALQHSNGAADEGNLKPASFQNGLEQSFARFCFPSSGPVLSHEAFTPSRCRAAILVERSRARF